MKTKLALSIFFFFCCLCLGQQYEQLDEKVRNYPEFESIEHLAIRIKNDFDSDILRVRAAFIWVTDNMQYGKTVDDFFKPATTIVYYSEKWKVLQLEKIQDEKIKDVFYKKQGVCFEYSILLKKLCDEFGLPSHIVKGIGKQDIQHIENKKLYKDHTWNAIWLDNAWRLFDATWASGFLNPVQHVFVRSLNERYFDAEPEELIKDHFPAERKWQLLSTPITLKEFYEAPIFLDSYFKNNIGLLPGMSGLINSQELLLSFENLPLNCRLNYSMDLKNGKGRMRTMRIVKRGHKGYTTRLKLPNTITEFEHLTVYLDKKPIIKFRVDF